MDGNIHEKWIRNEVLLISETSAYRSAEVSGFIESSFLSVYERTKIPNTLQFRPAARWRAYHKLGLCRGCTPYDPVAPTWFSANKCSMWSASNSRGSAPVRHHAKSAPGPWMGASRWRGRLPGRHLRSCSRKWRRCSGGLRSWFMSFWVPMIPKNLVIKREFPPRQ